MSVKRFLIDSTSRRLGDTMLGLALAPMIKYKWPDSKVHFACGQYETRFFRRVKVIDDVVIQSIFSAHQGNWNQYEAIIRTCFDVDDKWDYDGFFGGLDNPEGWKEVLSKGYDLSLSKSRLQKGRVFNVLNKMSPDKKKVGIFCSTPRKDISHPFEFSHLSLEKQKEIIKSVLDLGHEVILFNGIFEQSIPNVEGAYLLPRLSLEEEGTLFQYLDLLISPSTMVPDMLAPLFKLPTIVLHSCDEFGGGVWAGIPDSCVLPNLRYQTFCRMDGSEISYVKPPDGSRVVDWDFSHYWLGSKYKRKMRVIDDIPIDEIIKEIKNKLNGNFGREFFVNKEEPCKSCELFQKFGKCIYHWSDEYLPELNGKKWR